MTGMDEKTLKVEVRLESKDVPRDRISRIIWLHADELDPSKKPKLPGETTRPVQALRNDGVRPRSTPLRSLEKRSRAKAMYSVRARCRSNRSTSS